MDKVPARILHGLGRRYEHFSAGGSKNAGRKKIHDPMQNGHSEEGRVI
jgi:hypothetical protein